MAELEYRIKTTSMGAISRWRELTMEPDNAWDYQQHDSKIEYFEIRVKPTFEPGYFRYLNLGGLDGYSVPISAQWCTEDPGEDYERVNVTPAE